MNSILIDCERMKYPNTGPYHFCLRLGQELLQLQQKNENLTFLAPKEIDPFNQPEKSYFRLGALNKLYLPWSKSRFVPNTNQFDLWHSTYQSTMYYPTNKKTKVVLTIHDLNFLYEKPGDKKNKAHLALIQNRIDKATHIVCISQFCLQDVKQNFKINVPCSVIYNGGNSSSSSVSTPTYLPSKKFLFSIGTIYPKKNFHVLPPLLENNDFELIISGIDSSTYKEKIIAVAQQHNVAGRVKFTGPISEEEKNWYYQNCTAFLFPSIAEGFGLPVIEAMTYGKPVFLSTHTSLPEVGGKHAYYFNNFDSDAMKKDFNTGLSHYNVEQPAEEIKKWAAQFNWTNTAQSYFNLYRSLL